MNAKLCKRLRRQAEAETVGRPAVAYTHQHCFASTGTFRVDRTTCRGVYLRLKREARA